MTQDHGSINPDQQRELDAFEAAFDGRPVDAEFSEMAELATHSSMVRYQRQCTRCSAIVSIPSTHGPTYAPPQPKIFHIRSEAEAYSLSCAGTAFAPSDTADAPTTSAKRGPTTGPPAIRSVAGAPSQCAPQMRRSHISATAVSIGHRCGYCPEPMKLASQELRQFHYTTLAPDHNPRGRPFGP